MFAYGVSKYDWLTLDNGTAKDRLDIPMLPIGKLWVCADHVGLTAHSSSRLVAYREASIALCNTTFLESNPSAWTIDGHPISYCLAEEARERCTIQISTAILSIVIICNALKVVIMVYAILQCGQDSLVTLGDVMASFLATPDPRTSGACLMSQKYVLQGTPYPMNDYLHTWRRGSHRWSESLTTSKVGWFITT